MILESFIDYLEKEKRCSKHTVASYKLDLEQFAHYLSTTFDTSLLQAKSLEIRSYMMHLSEQKMNSKSIARKISTLRSFYKYMLRHGQITANPTIAVKTPKLSKRLPVFVDDTKLNELLDSETIFNNHFTSLRDKIIIELLFGSGIRLSELLNLQDTDLDFYHQTIKVLGKGSKERIIPIPTSLLTLLKKYIQEKNAQKFAINPTHLLVTDTGAKAYAKLIYRVTNKYLSFISNQDKKSPHVLRHTYATTLLNKGADLNAIKELLGHASLAATQVYTHNSIEKLKLIYKTAHPKA